MDGQYSNIDLLNAKLKETLNGVYGRESGKSTAQLIETNARIVAATQQMADIFYYTFNDQEYSSKLLETVSIIKNVTSEKGLWNNILYRALQIYDFSNSGREGYILKDGKIVKEESE